MSEEYYRKMLADNPDDPDYAALEQGPMSTARRHSLVAKHLDPTGRSILDLGCGTGLLMETLVENHTAPSRYVGVDFLPEREDAVLERARKLMVEAEFVAADVREFLMTTKEQFDLVVAPGLVGFFPFHSITLVLDLTMMMQGVGATGLITLPRPYDGFLGCAHQAHFDVSDVAVMASHRHWVKQPHIDIYSDRELALWWI